MLKKFFREQEGQDAIEYALLAGFLSLAIVTALGTLSGSLQTMYGNLSTAVNQAGQ